MYFMARSYLVTKPPTILQKNLDFKIKHQSNMKNMLKIKNRDMRTKTRKLHFEIQIIIFFFKVLSKDHSATLFLILLRKLSRKNVI